MLTVSLILQANNLTYGVLLPATTRIQLPYNFYSESVPCFMCIAAPLTTCTGSELAISNSVSGWNTLSTATEKKYPLLIPSLLWWSLSSLSSILSCTSRLLQHARGITNVGLLASAHMLWFLRFWAASVTSHISPSSLRPSRRRLRQSLHQKVLSPQLGQADTKRNGFRNITCARPRLEKSAAQLAQGTIKAV
jgi:hypothetical protein